MENIKNIDTLLFSGGAMKCISILGSLQYLFENNIIKENFEGIKEMYFVSGSAVYVSALLIGFSIEATVEIFKKIDYEKLSGIDDMKIQNIFENYGLKKITDYKYMINVVLRYKNFENITLKEFYDFTKIKLNFRVINLNKQCNEYLNKDNSPDLKYADAICMTSCIPLLFEPIKYNGCLYIDGGFNNNFPYEKIIDKENYLGINILSSKISCNIDRDIEEIKDLQQYLNIIYNVYGSPPIIKPSINHIKILINGTGVDFNRFSSIISDTILLGYNTTKEHFTNFQKHNDSSPHKNEG
tara:strand:+ start:66 stop:959 length:894 start_codon:yes stop_codon:yes gene_type:complete